MEFVKSTTNFSEIISPSIRILSLKSIKCGEVYNPEIGSEKPEDEETPQTDNDETPEPEEETAPESNKQ